VKDHGKEVIRYEMDDHGKEVIRCEMDDHGKEVIRCSMALAELQECLDRKQQRVLELESQFSKITVDCSYKTMMIGKILM